MSLWLPCLGQFLILSLTLMTLTFLKIIGHLFCRCPSIQFAWHFFMIRFRLCIFGSNLTETELWAPEVWSPLPFSLSWSQTPHTTTPPPAPLALTLLFKPLCTYLPVVRSQHGDLPCSAPPVAKEGKGRGKGRVPLCLYKIHKGKMIQLW